MNKQNLEQWISQLDEEGYCDISDKQVEALIRGFAALEEQRDALAAESAALKEDYRTTPALRSKGWPKTPATDAFLREVRAQGVEARTVSVKIKPPTIGRAYSALAHVWTVQEVREACTAAGINLETGGE